MQSLVRISGLRDRLEALYARKPGGHRLGLCLAVLMVPAITTAYADFSGSVDKIADGDTFWLCDATACHKIRLCGADAPEKGEPGYQESAKALKRLVQDKPVRCIQVGDGTPCDGRSKPTNHDRIVAQCFADGAAVPLVEEGFACDWVKFSGGIYTDGGKGHRCRANGR
jgi:endonuclease YncB( thermonuclease family)